MDVNTVISLATTLTLVVFGALVFVQWTVSRRQQLRLEERRLVLEEERLSRDDLRENAAQDERQRAREEEAAFRRATFIPQDDADGVFLVYAKTKGLDP